MKKGTLIERGNKKALKEAAWSGALIGRRTLNRIITSKRDLLLNSIFRSTQMGEETLVFKAELLN